MYHNCIWLTHLIQVCQKIAHQRENLCNKTTSDADCMKPLCSSNQMFPYLINSCHVEFERIHGGDESLDTACYVHCWVWALRVPVVPTTVMLRHLTSSQADMSLFILTRKLVIAIKATPGLAMFHCGWHAWLYQSLCSHGTLHVVVYQKLLYIWDLHQSSCSAGLLARFFTAGKILVIVCFTFHSSPCLWVSPRASCIGL